MSILDQAVSALSEKLADGFAGGSVKFAIEDEGSVIVDGDGVRASDDDADVTLLSDAETFQGIMSGDVDPTGAFMTGKLKIEGNMGIAMQLASILR